ncbi:MAG: hypothetical protein SOS98_03505 [Varibaculum sp.]|nr:hypothetical protein [Varibaculum sp.]
MVDTGWVRVFADLENRFAVAQYEEIQAEAAEVALAEQGRVSWLTRITPGSETTLVTGTQRITGRVQRTAASWILVSAREADYLVPVSAVKTITGLLGPGSELGKVQSKLSLGTVLRETMRFGGAIAVVDCSGGIWRGKLAWVGADHLDIDSVTVPYAAIDCVRLGR